MKDRGWLGAGHFLRFLHFEKLQLYAMTTDGDGIYERQGYPYRTIVHGLPNLPEEIFVSTQLPGPDGRDARLSPDRELALDDLGVSIAMTLRRRSGERWATGLIQGEQRVRDPFRWSS